LSCLVQANQEWAKNASVLVLGITHLTFDRTGKENKAAIHDLGAAVSHLSFEATTRGISVHQMIGIEPQKARQVYTIPEDYEVLIAFAIGYPDLSKTATDDLAIRDRTPRVRKTISEFVFSRSGNPPLYNFVIYVLISLLLMCTNNLFTMSLQLHTFRYLKLHLQLL